MSRIIDLTLPVVSGMAGIPKIPLYEQFPIKVQAATVVDEAQRAFLAAAGIDTMGEAGAIGHMNTVMTLQSHIGTHIDAPRHFFTTGAAIDELSLDRLAMRQAVVCDVSGKAPGSGITAEDLDRCGARPAAGQIAVIMTGWTDRAWGKPEFWENTIYLDPSVSEWTADRGLVAVAMDCFPEKPFWRFTLQPHERGANHKRWLGNGIPMIQLLTNLDQVGPRFTNTALPLRLTGMDGSPARVIGIVE